MSTLSCYTRPAYVPPTPLLRDPRSVIGSLQPGFTNSHFGFLLCVGPGSASSSFEVSRHQINDQHAKAFHDALNAAERAIADDSGRSDPPSSSTRRRSAHARPAVIPLAELHPHPVGAHVDEHEHAHAPHKGRAVELARALAARKAHAKAHKRVVRHAPVAKKVRGDDAAPSAKEAERAAVEEVVRGGGGGMQRKRLRAPRPLRRAASAMHQRDESVF